MLVLLVPASVLAVDATSSQFPADSNIVDVRTVDTSTLQNLTDERVFEYNELPRNPESLMNRILRWVVQTIQYILNNKWASVAIRFIFFGIFALVLIALINQILGGNFTSSFSKKKAQQAISLNIGETELNKTNYDELLARALNAKRYRDAVRILYLKSLQQLNESGLIAWKPDKTNHDYLGELGTHPARSLFSSLTLYYEYVEYGDFEIEESGFEKVQQIYTQFREQASAS
ncbi:MAG: DUF4129 domain-containing protein [Gracilimonas sp.]